MPQPHPLRRGDHTSAKTGRRPLLVAIAGPPLSGKTTLGDALSDAVGLHFCDVDRLRASAFGLPTQAEDHARTSAGEEMAAKLLHERMRLAYQLLHDGAVAISLANGRSLIVAATYSRRRSQEFLASAVQRANADIRVVHCRVRHPTREQLTARMRREHDSMYVSGCNNWMDYDEALSRYEAVTETGVFPAEAILEVDTGNPIEAYLPDVVRFVRQ